MKRLIASLAAIGLVAAPAVATTKAANTPTPAAKPTKAQIKAAKKAARTSKPAPAAQKSST